MSRIVRLLFIVFCSCFLMLFESRAQEVDSLQMDLDSLQQADLLARTAEILRADSLRRLDSLRQAELLDQLSRLQTSDNLKKTELLAEIEQLRNSDQLAKQKQRQQIDSLRALSEGVPVILMHDTLFRIYARVGPFSPSHRADYTVGEIKKIVEGRNFIPDSLRVVRHDDASDLVYREQVLLTVTPVDAVWADMDRDALTAHYREVIHQSISDQLEKTQLGYILRNMAAAAAILLVLYFVVKYVNRLYRKVRVFVMRGKGKWYHGIKIRDYELFPVEGQARAIVLIINILKWILIFVLVYLALLLLFGIFPWTKPIADTLIDYVMRPIRRIALSLWNYLPDLFTVIIILVIFRFVFKAFAYFRDEVAKGALTIPGFYPDWAKPTYQVLRILLFAFMIIIIYPYLPGSDSPVFQGVTVFLGVLLTFGSSSSLSNIMSGLVLTYTRAFKIGDRVRIGDSVGDIIEKNLLVTRLRTVNNEDITIPNSEVMNSHTINYSTEAQELGLGISSTIKVAYDVPWRQVHELLLDAAKKTKGVVTNPEPYVLQKALNDYYVSYEINAYTNLPNQQAGVYSRMHENIQDNFREAGISLIVPVHEKRLPIHDSPSP